VRRALVALLVLAGALAPTAGASPKPGPGEAIFCGPGERWCVAVFNSAGRRTLAISGRDIHGPYQVCVTGPKSKERCRSFTLVPNGGGGHQSRVRFADHFPHARHGRYKARWIYRGKQIGKTLSFPFPGLK
jgi:hypothetical protein